MGAPTEPCPHEDTAHAAAWKLVLAVAGFVRDDRCAARRTGLRVRNDTVLPCGVDGADVVIDSELERGWIDRSGRLDPGVASVLDLYLPLVVTAPREGFVLAHLAQSLDGRVATHTGVSQFISGTADLVHTHRLRALFDAVVVGAKTVECDDPQLTTRLAEGPSPTRVVIDPRGRLRGPHKLFSDARAPTIVLCNAASAAAGAALGANVRRIAVRSDEAEGAGLDVRAILLALRKLGLRRVFVEGGGLTVSRFLSAGVLDRLHVTVAPMIIGSGRPAFALPPIDDLEGAVRLECRRFELGPDILFDCQLRKLVAGE